MKRAPYQIALSPLRVHVSDHYLIAQTDHATLAAAMREAALARVREVARKARRERVVVARMPLRTVGGGRS